VVAEVFASAEQDPVGDVGAAFVALPVVDVVGFGS